MIGPSPKILLDLAVEQFDAGKFADCIKHSNQARALWNDRSERPVGEPITKGVDREGAKDAMYQAANACYWATGNWPDNGRWEEINSEDVRP